MVGSVNTPYPYAILEDGVIGTTVFAGETGGLLLPSGTTLQRPSPATSGTIRYNTTTGRFERYTVLGGWQLLAPVSVIDYGAKGDGVTDDTTAIQNALNAEILTVIPDGTYKITSGLVFTNAVQLDGTIDMSACANNAYGLACYGTNGTFYSLTANAVAAATTLTISSADLIASGIAADDWVIIQSESIFDPTRTSSKIGELAQVASVNTGTGVITFKSPIDDTYNTADTAQVAKVTIRQSPSVFGRGKVISDNTTTKRHTGVRFFFADNANLSGIRFEKMDAVGFQFASCVRSLATNIGGKDFNTATTGYLASVQGASRDIIIRDLRGDDNRHLFTTNNNNAADSYGSMRGIPRRVLVDGFTSANSDISQTTGGGGDALDTHAAAEDIHIWNGEVFDASGQGVNFECRSGSIKNVSVYGANGNGIRVHNETARAGEIELANLYVERVLATGSAAGTGIIVDFGSSTAGYKSIQADNLRAVGCASSGIVVLGDATSVVKNVQLSNLKSEDNGGNIVLEQLTEFTLNGWQVTGAAAGTYCLTVTDSKYGTIDVGMARLIDSASGGGAIRIKANSAGSCSDITVDGTRARSVTPTGGNGLFIDDNAQRITAGLANDFSECFTPYRIGSGAGHKILGHHSIVSTAGTTHSDATQLNGAAFHVISGAAGTGAKLPAGLSYDITVANRDASDALLVYPPTGAQIDSLGTNVGLLLYPGESMVFRSTSTTQTYSRQSLPQSGTYTPTLTNVANLDASTADVCQWVRVRDMVTVSGSVAVDPTLAATSTQLGISLPVASNFASASQCAGVAFASGIAGQGAAILADSTNDRAQMQFISADVTNQTMYFTFTYRVI